MIIVTFLFIIIGLVMGAYWLLMSPHSQLFGFFPFKKVTDEKIVALTFDDGPNEPYTSHIVDYLNSQGVKATFFQVGKCVERFPAVTKKIYDSGHTIGNHSLSHHFQNYFIPNRLELEIVETQNIIKNVIGKNPILFRPPWLFHQSGIFKILKRLGLQPISGEFCHPLEVWQPKAAKIAKRSIAKIKPGSIIIFHDGYDAKGGNRAQTVEAVKIVVETLLKQNYSFVTVDSLLGIPPYFS